MLIISSEPTKYQNEKLFQKYNSLDKLSDIQEKDLDYSDITRLNELIIVNKTQLSPINYSSSRRHSLQGSIEVISPIRKQDSNEGFRSE